MLDEEFSNQYSSSRVILHLARHGLELFLKASVIAATGSRAPTVHNLAELLLQYKEHLPGEEFCFRSPKAFALSESDDLFQEDLDRFHLTLDQRHRYPADRHGRDFAVPEVFEPRVFLSEIRDLDKQLKIIEFCHVRPIVRQNIKRNSPTA